MTQMIVFWAALGMRERSWGADSTQRVNQQWVVPNGATSTPPGQFVGYVAPRLVSPS